MARFIISLLFWIFYEANYKAKELLLIASLTISSSFFRLSVRYIKLKPFFYIHPLIIFLSSFYISETNSITFGQNSITDFKN